MTKRIEELKETLKKASYAYYNEDQEIMSNLEYDRLYDELRALEEQYGAAADSPTMQVGAPVRKEWVKKKHEKPALSLDKTKEISVLRDWLGEDQSGVLSWKMDGLTIVATYQNGTLQSAVTRGDGITGEEITENARQFHGLPKEIPFMGKLTVRAEAVMTYTEFERINNSLSADEEPYKNPRNLASGTVRRLNGLDDRNVEVYVFELVDQEGGKPVYVTDQFRLLTTYGFQVVGHYLVHENTLEDYIRKMENHISENPFPSDGLVLTYDDSNYAESLGTTGKYPRGSIAFKWQDEEHETTLRGVEWSPSATGLLNPVAVFDPVEIEGTTVTRASVHNVSYVESMQLGYGDTIKVYKANMIIPQISENLTRSDTIRIPDVCPVCGGPTKIHCRNHGDREIKTLLCTNPKCAAKHLGRFQRFVCRDAMNIVGISDETLRKFIEMGFLQTLTDIYHLEEHRSEIETMEGFGKKSADNLFAAIEKSKTVEPWRFLYAMSIPNVGRDASKKIIRFCGGTFAGFIEKLRFGESLLMADDIGDITNRSIYEWKENPDYMEELADLLDLVKFVETKNEGSDILRGKNIVITGTLETFKNRDEFVSFVEANGGKVVGSVSKKTTYLVNNDVFSASSKNKKAKELGIPILNEREFKNMVLGN